MPDKMQQLVELLEGNLGQKWLGLRKDIAICPYEYDEWKRPQWMVTEPISGEYFTLGQSERPLFTALQKHHDLSKALTRYSKSNGINVQAMDVFHFLKGLLDHGIAVPEKPIEKPANNSNWLTKYRSYLFYKKPILTPNALLDKLINWLSPLWSKTAVFIYIATALYGLAMVIPQWELFVSNASYLFSMQGAVVSTLSIVLLKIGHEFSHALTARVHGFSVRRMGILFMVLWPILYTDVSDAWRGNKRQRMSIDLAGVRFELVIAGLALALWSYLPDGIFRSVCFFLCGASLISTILINLNPLMRFDGYYVLMDWLGIANLQERSAALVKYRTRKLLWGWQESVPEVHPKQLTMFIYGIAVNIYRLFLGIGISFVVNSYVSPQIGVILFALTITALIIQPWFKELQFVRKEFSKHGNKRRTTISLLVLAALIAVTLIPFQESKRYPAFIQWQNASDIETSGEGILLNELPEIGQEIVQGDLIYQLKDEKLQSELQQEQLQLKALDLQLSNRKLSGEDGALRRTLLVEKQRQQAVIDKLKQATKNLSVNSPATGKVIDVASNITKGSTLARDTWLLTIADDSAYQAVVYILEKDLASLNLKEAMSISTDLEGFDSVDVTIKQTEPYSVRSFVSPAHYDHTGGSVSTIEVEDKRRTLDGYYEVRGQLAKVEMAIPHNIPAWVSTEAESSSILMRFVRKVTNWLAKDGLL